MRFVMSFSPLFMPLACRSVDIESGTKPSLRAGTTMGQAKLPDPLSDTLKADVSAMKALPEVATPTACKSSLTPTFVSQGGYHSGDLSCPANDSEKKLGDAVVEIARFLKVRNIPKGQGADLPPQTF